MYSLSVDPDGRMDCDAAAASCGPHMTATSRPLSPTTPNALTTPPSALPRLTAAWPAAAPPLSLGLPHRTFRTCQPPDHRLTATTVHPTSTPNSSTC
ncbi:hypothetical protein Nepgr_008273 [Nepenthes gracilis]|uniref:Uncharacterized protein n=1 Tax=Nepenthes gracilis TaxID=150966 RepID=A0AAD3XJ38_NEPGR|nr:hypothetical protein Nepgr_008273 [Nepenthes gracilis]